MPRQSREPLIVGEFFRWRLFTRDGVFYADGRTGKFNLGKHSLGTRDRTEATATLRRLDRVKATEFGLVPSTVGTAPEAATLDLPITDGWKVFLEDRNRSAELGGVGANTLKRYRAVRDKHVGFCQRNGRPCWSSINKAAVQRYAKRLEEDGYAPRSLYLETTLIVSLVKWLIDQGRLPRRRGCV